MATGSSNKRQRRYGKYSAGRKRTLAAVRIVDTENKNPPKHDLSIPQGVQMFRFHATAAQNTVTVTRAMLLSMVGACTTASTVLGRLFAQLKIMEIRAYAPPQVTGGSVDPSLAIEWLGTTSGSRVLDDMNVANTASYVRTKPPRSSDAAFWIQQAINESTGVFNLTCPVDAVIDIYIMGTMVSNYQPAHSTFTTTSGTTTGIFYFNALDGTTNTLRPATGLNGVA